MKSQPIIFPDPFASVTDITGAALLYFEHPLMLGLPAAVVPQVGERSLQLVRLVLERKPAWGPSLLFVLEQTRQHKTGVNNAIERLRSLQGTAFESVYLSYDASQETFDKSAAAALAVADQIPDVTACINVGTAACDLRRHIFLEKFLEVDENVEALYAYCADRFSQESIEQLLLSAYLLRIAAVRGAGQETGFLVTNPRVVRLLAAAVPAPTAAPSTDLIDMVAWELFRRILGPRIDPLTDDRIALAARLRNERSAERSAMVERCRSIATALVQQSRTDPERISHYVQTQIEPQVAELLRLDQKALLSLFDELASDSKTWLGIAGLIGGLVVGAPIVTAGSAIAALSALGASAYKTRKQTSTLLNSNDFRLLYHIDR